jgi:hypothetical protein
MNSNHPYDLVIGLDRSDCKADLHLINPRSAVAEKQTIDTSPEALHDWLYQLRQKQPQARVAICLEQPAANLILFLEPYSWITLYAINPITLQKFREAFVTSRAKDDGKDAQYLAELLLTHHDKLKAWQPDDSQTRQLQQLVVHRRAVIDERSSLVCSREPGSARALIASVRAMIVVENDLPQIRREQSRQGQPIPSPQPGSPGQLNS